MPGGMPMQARDGSTVVSTVGSTTAAAEKTTLGTFVVVASSTVDSTTVSVCVPNSGYPCWRRDWKVAS